MTGIRVELELEDGTFTQRVLHAGETIDQFRRNVERSSGALKSSGGAATSAATGLRKYGSAANGTMLNISKINERSKSFVSTMRDMVVIVGLAHSALSNIRAVTTGWAGDIIRVNAEFERTSVLMKSMSTAADPIKDATYQVKELIRFSKQAPFSMNAMRDGMVKLKATGTDPLNGSFKSLVDGVAAFGGTDDLLKRVSIAIFQMSGKGVIQMEELRQQVGEAIPRAIELMARSMGVTYGALVKEISRGTVQSKEALQLLFSELDRTFGGTAQNMMQLYTGQLQRTKTLLQEFALEVGNAGYFDAVKNQLIDLNKFLDSKRAEDLAKQLSSALVTIIKSLRSGLDWIIKFREEIVNTAKWMAIAWTGSKIVSGIGAVIGALGSVRTAYRLTYLQMTNTAIFGVLERGSIVAAGGLGILRIALRGTAVSVAFLGAAAGALLPWLPLLAGGVLAVSNYFGLFSEKGNKAVRTLKDFTFETQKELDVASSIVKLRADEYDREADRLEEQLRRFRRIRNTRDESGNGFNTRASQNEIKFYEDYEEKVKNLREKSLNDRKSIERAQVEYVRRATDDIVDARKDEVRKSLLEINRGYDKKSIALSKNYEKERSLLNKQGVTTENIDKTYGKRRRNLEVSVYDERIKILESFLTSSEELQRKSDESSQAAGAQLSDDLRQQLEQIYRQREQAKSMLAGIPTISKEKDFAAMLIRGEKQLDKLKAKAKGFKAEIAGAHGETAKLAFMLTEAGKYGDPGSEKVKALVEQLLSAQEEVNILNDLMKGRQSFDRDAAALQLRLEEKLFEATNRHLSETDKLNMKVKSGFYKGIGPKKTVLETQIINIKTALSDTKNGVAQLATSFKDDLFGQSMFDKARSWIDVIKEMTGAVTGLNDTSNGNGLDKIVDKTGELVGNVSRINTQSSFADRIRNSESNNDPTATSTTSTAAGSGMFTKATWFDFMKENYSEFATLSEDYQLSLRSNQKMMNEAINWYAEKNAGILSRNNVASNDVTLQLSHQLGAGGAMKVLGAELGASLKDVLSPAAIEANPSFEGKTIRWLINQSAAKMGFSQSDYLPRSEKDSKTSVYGTYSGKDDATNAQTRQRLEQQATAQEFDNELQDKIKALGLDARQASEFVAGLGKNVVELRKNILAGDYGPDKDPESKRYASAIEWAKKLDIVQKNAAEQKKARSKSDRGFDKLARREEELAIRRSNAILRIGDPQERKFTGAYLSRLNELNTYVSSVETAYGRDSAAYVAAVADKSAALRQFQSVESLESVAGLASQNVELRRSLLSQTQIRNQATNFEVENLRRLVSEFKGSADDRVRIEAVVQDRIQLLRQKTAQETPMGQMLKEWQDLGGGIDQAMTGWLDGAADQMATFVTTGKADFQSLTQSILADMTKMIIKAAIGTALGMPGGGTKGGGQKVGAPIPIGTAHTGGIVGSAKLIKSMVSPGLFGDAPKFHTGGIVGGRRLTSSEVPIIAQEGEGVFTREQMKAMGGRSGGISISAPITVNGGGGTQEQNDDLSTQISEKMEATMRGVVVDELREQMRPGNMMGN